jgi:hypothetical protein
MQCLVLSQLTSNLHSILIEITVCSYEHVHKHKVNSIEYHSVCPLVGIGTPPPRLLQASVPPPRNQTGGKHSPAGGGGDPNSDDWKKVLKSAYSVYRRIHW